MNRRQLLGASASAIAAALMGTTALAGSASHTEYSRDAYEQALASGKPFMLDFYASW